MDTVPIKLSGLVTKGLLRAAPCKLMALTPVNTETRGVIW